MMITMCRANVTTSLVRGQGHT